VTRQDQNQFANRDPNSPVRPGDIIEVIEEEIIEEISEPAELLDRVIHINRVAKVVKGGRKFHFTALVAMGDGMGRVGLGYGKAGDVLGAIKKGQEYARKSMITIPLQKGTIPHAIVKKYSAAKVILRPASDGTGIIAGGPVRSILEVAGVHNILAKAIGRTNNQINVARATFEALKELKSMDEIRARRRAGSDQ